jgi:hypothetical protein
MAVRGSDIDAATLYLLAVARLGDVKRAAAIENGTKGACFSNVHHYEDGRRETFRKLPQKQAESVQSSRGSSHDNDIARSQKAPFSQKIPPDKGYVSIEVRGAMNQRSVPTPKL